MALPRLHHRRAAAHRAIPHPVREFGRIVWNANVTGLSSMLAYNLLLGVVPLALLGLFVAGQVLSSPSAQAAVERDLQDIFPDSTKSTLESLLHQISHATPTTGVLALVASLWLASSFWGSLDTAFSRIYGCSSRPWLKQKRFALGMVVVMVLFMLTTITVPALQSLIKAGAERLPFTLRHVHGTVYVVSLVFTLVVLFGCLATIYKRVPNTRIPWRAVWPGALAATVLMGIVDAAFPVYLTSISTIAHFQSTVVFIIIVLGWFYVVSLIILAGAVMNSVALRNHPG